VGKYAQALHDPSLPDSSPDRLPRAPGADACTASDPGTAGSPVPRYTHPFPFPYAPAQPNPLAFPHPNANPASLHPAGSGSAVCPALCPP